MTTPTATSTTLFDEFVELFNSKISLKSNYYNHVNGMERDDQPYIEDDKFSDYTDFLCDLMFENCFTKILAKKHVDFDADKDINEYEVVFETEGKKYFITVTETCDDYQCSRIYPVTSEKEVKATEYSIGIGKRTIKVKG